MQMEQKKEYNAPEMKVVELKQQTNLLQSSGTEPKTFGSEIG